jgi:hypothetical protein
MPCYRCGARQADPEPGKPTPWRQGLLDEHQVLICPACFPVVRAGLARCSRCAGVRLVRRLDQVECLDCRLVRSAAPVGAEAVEEGDSALAAEVARALDRIRGAD